MCFNFFGMSSIGKQLRLRKILGSFDVVLQIALISFEQIYSQASDSSAPILLKTLCGQTNPLMVTAMCSSLQLVFVPTSGYIGRGYNITYRVKVPPDQGNLALKVIS